MILGIQEMGAVSGDYKVDGNFFKHKFDDLIIENIKVKIR